MVEYSVVLMRDKRRDVYIFTDESMKKAVLAMRDYVKKNGFTVQTNEGRFTIIGVHLIIKEPIAGSPIINDFKYLELFNEDDSIKKDTLALIKEKEG